MAPFRETSFQFLAAILGYLVLTWPLLIGPESTAAGWIYIHLFGAWAALVAFLLVFSRSLPKDVPPAEEAPPLERKTDV